MFIIAELQLILVIAGDVFDVGNIPFERPSDAAVDRGAVTGAFVAILLT